MKSRLSRATVLGMGWFAMALATTPARALEHVRPVELFVDQKIFEKMTIPDGPLVRLTEQDFTDLMEAYDRERARRLSEKPPAPDPRPEPESTEKFVLPWVLDRATLEGRAEGRICRTRCRVELSVYGDGPRAIPLFMQSTAIGSVSCPRPSDRIVVVDQLSDETRSRLGTDSSAKVYYLTRGAGRRELEFSTVFDVHQDRSRLSTVLHLPPAIIQDLTLEVAGPISALKVSGEASFTREPVSEGEGAVLSMRTSRRPRMELSWMRHAGNVTETEPTGETPKLTPRISANVTTLHGIGARGIRFTSQVQLRNSRSEVSNIRLQVPLGVNVRQVEGPDVQGHRPRIEDGVKSLTVHLRQPLRGSTTITLVGEATLPPASDEGTTLVALPHVGIPQAIRIQGHIGVASFATYQVQDATPDGGSMKSISSTELPPQLKALSTTPILLGYRFSVRNGAGAAASVDPVRVQLTRFEGVENLSTVINQLNAVTVVTPNPAAGEKEGSAPLKSVHRLVLKVTNARGRYLRVALPDSAEILASFVDLDPQAPSRDESASEKGTTEYLIALKRSEIIDGQMLPFPVEIAYRLDLDHELSSRGSLEFPVPRFSAPIVNANWNVYFPDGSRPTKVTGLFDWSQKERDLVLVQYGRDLLENLIQIIYFLLLMIVPISTFVVVGRSLLALMRRKSGKADPEEAPTSSGSGLLVSLIIITAIIGVLSAIAVPNFKRARERSNVRACFANQKTIAGALEMYNLDKNTNVTHLDTSMLETLRKEGYLQSVPGDPGQGGRSASNYRWTPDGNGITCTQHGSIQGHYHPRGR